jgi:hypothetical protein
MSKKSTVTTETIQCVREIPGEYVHAGTVYKVTRNESNRGMKATAYFHNILRGSGTSMPEWQVRRAIANGSLKVFTAADPAVLVGMVEDGMALYANVALG